MFSSQVVVSFVVSFVVVIVVVVISKHSCTPFTRAGEYGVQHAALSPVQTSILHTVVVVFVADPLQKSAIKNGQQYEYIMLPAWTARRRQACSIVDKRAACTACL